MPRLAKLIVLSACAAACHGGGGSATAAVTAPHPAEHSLATIAAQHVAVLPTYAVRVMPGLAWSIPPAAELRRRLDADILAAFDARGLRRNWSFPDQLAQSYRRNSSYATDPYAFAEEPLRTMTVDDKTHLPDPLASQIRTMVALQEDTRLVLAPVELRLDTAGTGGVGVLRVTLMDARTSDIRWIGDIVSDTVPAFGPAITASIAARLAGVISPR